MCVRVYMHIERDVYVYVRRYKQLIIQNLALWVWDVQISLDTRLWILWIALINQYCTPSMITKHSPEKDNYLPGRQILMALAAH